MARYVLAAYTNSVVGREVEFNDWYDDRHLDDVLNVPGVVSARRFELSPLQLVERPQTHAHLALYEVEIDDIQIFIDAMRKRSGGELMPISSALAPGTVATLWKARGD